MSTEDQEQDWIKELRAKAKRVDALERDNAVLKAGIDTENPVYELFEKSYDGELTVEAIKASAGKYGLLKSAAPAKATEEEAAPEGAEEETPPSHTSDEEAAAAAVSKAANGGSDPETSNGWQQAGSIDELVDQYEANGGQVERAGQ